MIGLANSTDFTSSGRIITAAFKSPARPSRYILEAASLTLSPPTFAAAPLIECAGASDGFTVDVSEGPPERYYLL